MTKKIKVVHVISDLPYGGVEKFLLDLLPPLNKDFDIKVCCIREKGILAQEFEKIGIPVDLIYFKGRLHPLSLRNMSRYLKKEKIDILHSHMYRANTSGTVSAKLAKTPVVIGHIHSYPEWDDKKQQKMDGFLSRWKDKIIAVSNSVKKDFIKATGVKEDKLLTIYNGIDLKRFDITIDFSKKKRELGIPEKALVIGIFARLIEDKRHEVFLQAAKILTTSIKHDVRFLIVGEGKLDQNLKLFTSDLGINNKVIFTGLREDVPELLKITDISVLSSKREGFPMIILESMACGVPCITTNVGGISEVIKDGITGYLVEKESPKSLSDAILSIIEDTNKRKTFSENCQKKVKSFTIENTRSQLADLYDNLLSGKKGRL
jgi:glycosyltransferase involved in cell wall biosynthesis